METTYRLKAKEIDRSFLSSLRTLFEGQEVEITVKTVSEKKTETKKVNKELLKMIDKNRKSAPVVSPELDIRSLIDEARSVGSI